MRLLRNSTLDQQIAAADQQHKRREQRDGARAGHEAWPLWARQCLDADDARHRRRVAPHEERHERDAKEREHKREKLESEREFHESGESVVRAKVLR